MLYRAYVKIEICPDVKEAPILGSRAWVISSTDNNTLLGIADYIADLDEKPAVCTYF